MTLPSARAPGISSCMRLMQRTSVDLPQPDGPMIAVTSLGANSRLDALHRVRGRRSRRRGRRSVTPLAARRSTSASGSALGAPARLGAIGRLVRRSAVAAVGVSLGRLALIASRLLRWIRRATRVSSRIMSDQRKRSAPRALDEAVLGLADVVEDLERAASSSRSPRSNVVPCTIVAVNSSGAVSPAARATASSEPVTSPGSAVGSTIREDDPPARRAERERRLAQRVGHEAAARPRPSG